MEEAVAQVDDTIPAFSWVDGINREKNIGILLFSVWGKVLSPLHIFMLLTVCSCTLSLSNIHSMSRFCQDCVH
jgi:hypothetical protein